jgi:PhnB protein
MKGITVSLGIDDPAEAERIFGALAEGGTVQMPIQQTFWAARFGMLTDRFGTPWMINCEQRT